MNKVTILLWLIAVTSCSQKAEHHHDREETPASSSSSKSPSKSEMANIGATHVHISYQAPSVRNRIIWGGLVPYGEVWVAGAHKATSIQFSSPVEIDGKLIPEGKYAFFVIPDEESWTLILNSSWDQHLTDEYLESEDVHRWEVMPEVRDFAEQLYYHVNAQDSTISFGWEQREVRFSVIPK